MTNGLKKGFVLLFTPTLFLGMTLCASASELRLPAGVKTIGEEAFRGDGSLDRVILPEGLETIDAFAFHQSGVTQVSFPGTLKTIGIQAFDDCDRLAQVFIPDGVESIGDYAFFSCDALSYVSIPASVGSIGVNAFSCCSGDIVLSVEKNSYAEQYAVDNYISYVIDTSSDYMYTVLSDDTVRIDGYVGPDDAVDVVIPRYIEGKRVTEIGDMAFYEKNRLSGSLTIPDSVTSIGIGAFYDCSGFTGSLAIPSGVTSIGDNAFSGCSGFSGSLTIPDGVTGIGECAFVDCTGFTGSLTNPDSVTDIAAGLFTNCSGFTGSLILPSGVTGIGAWAFAGCSGLTGDLTLPSGVTGIGEYAFFNCSSFTGSLALPSGVTGVGDHAFYCCSGFNGSLTIPDSVTGIGDYAFYGCSGFTGSLAIPSGVTSIGPDTFDGCTGLEKVNVRVIGPDGTLTTVERTAVYCLPGSYSWSWAENDADFEPVEWDGVSRPGGASGSVYLNVWLQKGDGEDQYADEAAALAYGVQEYPGYDSYRLEEIYRWDVTVNEYDEDGGLLGYIGGYYWVDPAEYGNDRDAFEAAVLAEFEAQYPGKILRCDDFEEALRGWKLLGKILCATRQTQGQAQRRS